MFTQNNDHTEYEIATKKRKTQRKITPQRLKNIGLYYLQRFETTKHNLRNVLRRRIDKYAYENPEYGKQEAYQWVEEILQEFEEHKYLDDARFAELKIKDYLAAGKPARYIHTKLREKGVDEETVNSLLQNVEYDPLQMALTLIKRKKIGNYRPCEQRKEYHMKDLAALVRAGFDYDVATAALNYEIDYESEN